MKVDESTEWLKSMVVVEKPNGVLRICLDPRDLNKVMGRVERNDDFNFAVPFNEIQKHIVYNTQGEIIRNKKDEPTKRLTPVKNSVNGKYLLAFIDAVLPEITYH